MYRNKPPYDAGFRAPQFSVGRAPDTWPGAELATPGEDAAEMAAALRVPSSSSPTVVVRRKRRVDLPVNATAPAPASEASELEHRPRVFIVKKEGADTSQEAGLTESGDASISTAPVALLSPETPSDEDAAAQVKKALRRRRRVPDITRPSEVVVTRPSVAEQLEAVEEAAAAHEEKASASPFTFDLFINARWGYVDKALQALKESVSSKRGSRQRRDRS